MILKDEIQRNGSYMIKWAKKLVDSGEVTPGVKHAPAPEFLSRIEASAELLPLVRYIEMEGEIQDIEQLRVRAKLVNKRKITGGNKGAQVTELLSLPETVPDLRKKQLVAKSFVAFTQIEEDFVTTNIEEDAFLAKYQSIFAPACAFAVDQAIVYGKATESDSMGYHAIDGIIAQLDDIASEYLDETTHLPVNAKKPQGHYGVHWNSESAETDKTEYIDIHAGEGYEVFPQIHQMLLQYVKQRGDRKNVKLLVSHSLEEKLLFEASQRPTTGGDSIFFGGETFNQFLDTHVIALDVMDEYLDDEGNAINGYGEVVFLCDPQTIAYGPLMEGESVINYELLLLSYVCANKFMFDVGIIDAEDILYANVDYTAKPSA